MSSYITIGVRLHNNSTEHSFSALLHESDKAEEDYNSEDDDVETNTDDDGTGHGSGSGPKSLPATLNRHSTIEKSRSVCVGDGTGEYMIARVTVEDGASALTTGINYRTIKIRETDRVKNIITSSLQV